MNEQTKKQRGISLKQKVKNERTRSHTETIIENSAPTYKNNKRPKSTKRSKTRELEQEEKVRKTKKKGLFLRTGVQDRSR